MIPAWHNNEDNRTPSVTTPIGPKQTRMILAYEQRCPLGSVGGAIAPQIAVGAGTHAMLTLEGDNQARR